LISAINSLLSVGGRSSDPGWPKIRSAGDYALIAGAV
jgi:hypothetical protein